MINKIFTKSEGFKQEYSATIVKVGELKDIENSDNLKQVIIDGFSVVVNKNDVSEGDLMIYCKNETALNNGFLAINNMYEIGEYELNSNHEEVEKLINDGDKDSAKKLVGYFNKHGRVKMLKLRGCYSMGVLLRLESFIKWDTALANVNLNDYITYDENGNFIPFDFDTVNDRLFIKAYVPPIKEVRHSEPRKRKKDASKKFDRMIEGEFLFHYDTNQLNSNMWKFNPEQIVDISVKVHGTSFIFGNVEVKKKNLKNKLKMYFNTFKDKKIKRLNKEQQNTNDEQLKFRLEQKIAKLENKKFHKFDTEFADIYSSRTVIKNKNINKNVNSGYYNTDIWGDYYKLLEGKIPENYTIYGEIVGYLTGSQSMIQKKYDYGCNEGENKLMIYRVSKKQDDSTRIEFNISEVIALINELKRQYPEIADKLLDFTLLYHGKLSDLYPNVDIKEHWNENILEKLKTDNQFLKMECDEPMCKNKVPREGIVIRIENDTRPEAFKLKCLTFLGKESKEIDAGNVDIEMLDSYSCK